jgi:hypothetical protein
VGKYPGAHRECAGPASALLSRFDSRVVVICNRLEIGRTKEKGPALTRRALCEATGLVVMAGPIAVVVCVRIVAGDSRRYSPGG